jgi:hypothetical protein
MRIRGKPQESFSNFLEFFAAGDEKPCFAGLLRRVGKAGGGGGVEISRGV